MNNDPIIHFQDDSFMIIQKPFGWIVNEATTTKNQPVIQTWIKNTQSFRISHSDEYRSGIVHRLDKETSGALIIAKTSEAYDDLQRQFKERIVSKTYLALVHDIVKPESGSVDVPVGRLPWRRDRFGVLPGGRNAFTSYKTIDHYERLESKSKFTLLELYPKTGRTHQIRIHMKHINHPLVADEFYAGRKTARNDRLWCSRLFLHAFSIEFDHPVSKKSVSYQIPLAEDLKLVLERITRLAI